MSRAVQVGVISDTHGLWRPEVLGALAGVDLIVHAGDVGSPDVLRSLETIAPVRAVRGHNDHGPWAEVLPPTDVGVLYLNPGSAGPRRFRLPVALARLGIRGRQVHNELVDLLP